MRRKTLAKLVNDCYFENRRRYGSRRIKEELNKRGIAIGRYRVRSLMREQDLRAIAPKKYKPITTDSKGTKASPNLLKEIKLEECAVAKIIIGDITYIPLQNGSWCYLAVWQDKVTRRIIGWSLAETMTQDLVISALRTATRKGFIETGAIVHSDRGSQYASKGFRELLRIEGFRQSMSGKGNCYDNAQAESFFSRFKMELIENGAFEDISEARTEIFSYIEGYYNRVRLHSSLGYQSPMEYELNLKTKNGGKDREFFVH
jgi:transposase InsO family protein